MNYSFKKSFSAPVRLSDLIKHYSQALDCSYVAAAWELCETFKEIDRHFGRYGSVIRDHDVCRVGSVSEPERTQGGRLVTLRQIVAYFESCVKSNAPNEFIECSVDNTLQKVPAAAVCVDLDKLWQLLTNAGLTPPYNLVRYNPPTGRSLGTFRAYHAGLIEIISNCARRNPDDPFCKIAASLAGASQAKDLSRMLRRLADELANDEFPAQEALSRILSGVL